MCDKCGVLRWRNDSTMSKDSEIIVLGAGVIGVTTAWYLQNAGFDVTVIDRQPDVALETSKANGGQISVSHAEPWASAKAPMQILKWAFNKNAPLRYIPSLDASHLRWGMSFLANSTHKKYKKNVKQLVALGNYSRQELIKLRQTLKLDYLQQTKGILHFYSQQKLYQQAILNAEYMSQVGCNRSVLDLQQTLKTCPQLASVPDLIGSTYTIDDESGNAHIFTQQLAEHCKNKGVTFIFDTQINKIDITNTQNAETQIFHLSGVTDTNEDIVIKTKKVIICSGSYSSLLAKQLGIYLPVYPAKGYSATYTVTDATLIPEVSMIDDAHKLVFSRFKNTESDVLRVAGMAEIYGGNNKYNTRIDETRANLITQRVRHLFPKGLDFSQPNYWTGLRPTTPNNIPIIKQSQIDNLYFNTGHGTLGWTHACGSAKLMTDIILQNPTALSF